MRNVTKIAFASLAVLVLGSSVSIAQPYGYGYVPPANSCPPPPVNYIRDPATGQVITEAEYRARYPWTDPGTWQHDCATNLWTDLTPQGGAYYQGPAYPQAPTYQAPAYYGQGRGYYRQAPGYHRESRNDNHDRGHGNQHADSGHHDNGHKKG